MKRYLKSKKSNCKNCYKCIRHCPVKAIHFSNDQAFIDEDECILCGNCYVACPRGAKVIDFDIDKVKDLLASGKDVYCSLAPSFVANYKGSNLATMEKTLKKLGFAGVEETAIGATMVKEKYDEMVKEKQKKVIISSCCHTVNTLIQKYYPEALQYLAPVVSPMQAHCKKIKEEHPDCYTVFIGPCISKKEEADEVKEIVDAVLTFQELSDWMMEDGIEIENVEDTYTPGLARLFPTTGGILNTMKCDVEDFSYISIDGIDNCMSSLKDIINGEITNCFIEMSACKGSCIGGPAMDNKEILPISNLVAVKKYAGEKDFDIEESQVPELDKKFKFIGIYRQKPGSSTIEDILHKMGKMTKEQELNCGSCGYNTCREKAAAVAMGKADLTMCLPFLKERAESFSDTIIGNTPNGIIVLNEELEVQQINKAACRILNVRHQGDIMNSPVVRILDPIDFIRVLGDKKNVHEKRTYLAEYKKYIEQTIIYDHNYHILIGILRDVTEEEIERSNKEKMSQQTVEIADRVIEKQMRVVQEIASLLGETTAETKIALTNLKETLKNE